MYYGARYYDAYLNRWTQPDSIVPNPYNPQELNRYSYARNNPVRYTDPTGHCPVCLRGVSALGGAIGGAIYGYGSQVANNLNQGMGWNALTSNIDPGQIVAYTAAGTIIGGTLGTGIAAADAVLTSASAAKIVTTAGTVAAAANADGDPTNELTAATQAAQSVWKLNPLQRGVAIENMLGRSPQLSQNFPVIDRFENGLATSIKSIDLGAASYQNINGLTSTVKDYVNTLANWQGARWANVTINASDIIGRKLLLAVPPDATQEQLDALEALTKWATTVGVDLETTVVP